MKCICDFIIHIGTTKNFSFYFKAFFKKRNGRFVISHVPIKSPKISKSGCKTRLIMNIFSCTFECLWIFNISWEKITTLKMKTSYCISELGNFWVDLTLSLNVSRKGFVEILHVVPTFTLILVFILFTLRFTNNAHDNPCCGVGSCSFVCFNYFCCAWQITISVRKCDENRKDVPIVCRRNSVNRISIYRQL